MPEPDGNDHPALCSGRSYSGLRKHCFSFKLNHYPSTGLASASLSQRSSVLAYTLGSSRVAAAHSGE
ncbi:MAG: hypothetical protein PHH59_00990 [Methylovulum sp.]|uniref:hypothetical protein n=1 Tax=Methylovulum sp. TaxID=1916980 RepID=UPI00261958B9|nr:hypothetical protein [Methylovulum sp.]MDD2722583.1 hypothetical protein [Methylovulum sp.]